MIYIIGMPIEYNGLFLGYAIPEEEILEYASKRFRKKYFAEKENFSKNIIGSVIYLQEIYGNPIKNILLKNFSPKYKAAQTILKDEALKEVDILSYIAKQDAVVREGLKGILEDETENRTFNKTFRAYLASIGIS